MNLMNPLPRSLQALVTWTAILPLVLAVSALVAPLTVGWPNPLRTALVITVVVPLAVFWFVPLLARAAQRTRRAVGENRAARRSINTVRR
ncbi:hypothetical protein [Dietzia sp. PP-33]|jgi:antibiotic biosynthesis monooxygenase (ABM) superfamily enzyme|uniref:hypothetical protein n=1 Tax=Dietzia sp. PP-33 TaxID=2957500 RepID=UPI0029B4438B|nr:hypothetical protein [Dietzia sp. PP-33]MDX2357727.1 hypothetical protein [Dietzia sp. PP-33]